MAAQQRSKGLAQRWDVEFARDFQRSRQVVGGCIRLELIEKPEHSLRERERKPPFLHFWPVLPGLSAASASGRELTIFHFFLLCDSTKARTGDLYASWKMKFP